MEDAKVGSQEEESIAWGSSAGQPGKYIFFLSVTPDGVFCTVLI